MAQAGYTPIQLYFSTTAAAVPLAANLAQGELAINIVDGKLYYENSSGVVTLLASAAGASGDVVGPASATDNALARFDLTTGKLIQNSVGILSDAGILTGLTGITSSGSITFSSLTSGRVPYATTAGLLTDSANLLYSGTDLTVYGLTVGRGAGAVATNTAVGVSALQANTTGSLNSAFGYQAAYSVTTNPALSAFGYQSGFYMTDANDAFGHQAMFGGSGASGYYNSAFGYRSLYSLTSGLANTAIGRQALFSNTTASNNTAVGYQAAYSGTTATQVVAVGSGALYANTVNYGTAVGFNALTANTTGAANAAFGAYALSTNTTGAGNSAFGALGFGLSDSALQANTTGSYNSAFGLGALAKNTTASNNTAVGYQAGYSNTTGGFNVFVGRLTGYANTTALYNVAVGSPALYSNTTGTSVTAIGDAALYYNTTGSYNTALGTQALQANTTSSNNTAVGYRALYSQTTSVNPNVAVGREAGYSITTGGYNSIFGELAGYNLSTGTSNTFIGVVAGYNSTGSNNTFIGSGNDGYGAGWLMTTGSKNTILGAYSGNQGGLDIRSSSNYVVLSDGDGNPRMYADSTGNWKSGGVVKQGQLDAYNGNATVGSSAVCLVFYSLTGTATVTLPTPASSTGRFLYIKSQSAYTVVSASSNVTDLANGSVTTSILPATAGSWATLFCDGTYWNIMAAG